MLIGSLLPPAAPAPAADEGGAESLTMRRAGPEPEPGPGPKAGLAPRPGPALVLVGEMGSLGGTLPVAPGGASEKGELVFASGSGGGSGSGSGSDGALPALAAVAGALMGEPGPEGGA